MGVKVVSWMRVWDIAYVCTECPYCGMEIRWDPSVFDDEELWHQSRFVVECEHCGEAFFGRVDDDDR